MATFSVLGKGRDLALASGGRGHLPQGWSQRPGIELEHFYLQDLSFTVADLTDIFVTILAFLLGAVLALRLQSREWNRQLFFQHSDLLYTPIHMALRGLLGSKDSPAYPEAPGATLEFLKPWGDLKSTILIFRREHADLRADMNALMDIGNTLENLQRQLDDQVEAVLKQELEKVPMRMTDGTSIGPLYLARQTSKQSRAAFDQLKSAAKRNNEEMFSEGLKLCEERLEQAFSTELAIDTSALFSAITGQTRRIREQFYRAWDDLFQQANRIRFGLEKALAAEKWYRKKD